VNLGEEMLPGYWRYPARWSSEDLDLSEPQTMLTR
jgi:hypothetical protein